MWKLGKLKRDRGSSAIHIPKRVEGKTKRLLMEREAKDLETKLEEDFFFHVGGV